MALSPEEAFLSREDRKQLIKLEKGVDEVLSGYTGGNGPIHFTHTPHGGKEPSSSVLNALMKGYERMGWKVNHVNTKKGKGVAFCAF